MVVLDAGLKHQENEYVSIGFQRSMYKMGVHMGWRKMIKENGGTEKDLAR